MSSLKHVAIIMDGNGRWANSRLHQRIWGHVRGASVISDIVEEADELKVAALTLFAFSSENWSRPLDEVKSLFSLLKKYIVKEKKRIQENKIRFRVIGDISQIPNDAKALIEELESLTENNCGLQLNFAFSYGGRNEILRAVNKFIEERPGKTIDEVELEKRLYLSDIGDVDLLIRTGGDQRVSNFLLWQIAYAELYFSPVKWPDFTREQFRKICLEVSLRERRFGGVLSLNQEFNDNLQKIVERAKNNREIICETSRE